MVKSSSESSLIHTTDASERDDSHPDLVRLDENLSDIIVST